MAEGDAKHMRAIPKPQAMSQAEPTFDEKMELVEQAIDAHGSYLLHYLQSLTKNRHDAENLQSELWIYVLHRFRPENIPRLGMLRRKAYQLFVDHYRNWRRDPVAFVEDPPEKDLPSVGSEPYTQEEQDAFRRRFFDDYPVGLPPEHEEALWLHAWCGHSFQEVAGIMGKPSSTIGDWISGARRAFSDYLNSNPQ